MNGAYDAEGEPRKRLSWGSFIVAARRTTSSKQLVDSLLTANRTSENALRAYADSLYNRVQWSWFDQDESSSIVMAWKPEQACGPHAYHGYNEAMILYILTLGSPTFPIGPESWGIGLV